MMKIERTLIGLLTLSFIVVSVAPPAMSAPQLKNEFSLNYKNAPTAGKDNVRFVISSESNAWSYSSYINPHTKNKNYDAFLPPCKESKIQVCVESVETKFGSSAWKFAEVLPDSGHPAGEVPTFTQTGAPASYKYSTFEGDLENFLPPGGNPRLWKSNEENLQGSLISVVADVHGAQIKDSSGLALQLKLVTDKQDLGGCRSINGEWKPYEGAKPNSGFCNAILEIPTELEFRVKLKFSGFEDPIKGWFTSTVLNPQIDYTGDTLTLSGRATAHGNFVSDPIPYTEYCEIYKKNFPQNQCAFESRNNSPNGSQSFLSREWGPYALLYQKYFQDKSLGEQNLWLFESTFQTPFNTIFYNQIPGCKLSKPIFGVISTDAALYNISDLKWNGQEKNFEYSIFSTHLNSQGAVNSGFFALLIDRTVANCLWKTELTTAKAVLSIAYEDGTSEIVTTTIGKNDSWITFSAAGFHYSRPKFTATLDFSEKVLSSGPTQIEKPKKKLSTIYCFKGKQLKKISSQKPLCPTGYRLKK
jgi:hypothetical protein